MSDTEGAVPVPPAPTGGYCVRGFESVADAFRENFAHDGEWGGAACVIVDGRCVVDLWGGYTDLARTTPWAQDTLVNAYSTGKGVLAMLVMDAVSRGELDLDAPVSRTWPDFAAAGKGAVRLRTLLSHRAGLPAVRPLVAPEVKYDWPRMCRLLAGEQPFWEPGRAHGYHSNTYGFLIGEVLRRATGVTVGTLLRERLAGPAAADFYWGLPESLHARVAPMLFTKELAIEDQIRQGAELLEREAGTVEAEGMIWRGYFNPPGISGFGAVNTEAWRNATIPSTNGHANARALARLYDCALRGAPTSHDRRHSLGSAALLKEFTRIHADGTDRVLGRPSRFGLGFQLPQPDRPIGPNTHTFGHFGHGGSLGFADPDARLAFGYVTNRPGARFIASRALRVANAVYAAL